MNGQYAQDAFSKSFLRDYQIRKDTKGYYTEMYKNAWYMRLCALSRCIFSPSEYAFTINRQGRNTGGTAQASSGRRENPAAVADPLREIPAQATGRLQTDQKVETLRPPQLVQAAEDPRRKAGRLQTSSGRRSESRCRRQIHAGSWKATDRIRPAQATAGVPLPL